MAARNDITGDEIKTGSSSTAYEDGWDRIFGKKDKTENHTDGYPNDTQFETTSVPNKIKDRMDHLQQLMEGNNHLARPEYVLDVIESVSKFWSVLNEEDKDYIQCATDAVRNNKEWNV
jgi:hypothetical protein